MPEYKPLKLIESPALATDADGYLVVDEGPAKDPNFKSEDAPPYQEPG
jgi:hypothetical protein